MQTNVATIKQAAAATGLFQVVAGKSLLDNRDYPAFVVGDRSTERQNMNANHDRYLEPWRYQCFVMHEWDQKKSEDVNFTELQNAVDAVNDELVKAGGALIEEHHGEAHLSGKELIIAEITVEIDNRRTYGR